MKMIKRLGEELLFITTDITNIYITHDFVTPFKIQYKDAVDNHVRHLYNPMNDFEKVLVFDRFADDKSIREARPYADMTIEDPSAEGAIAYIIENHSVYCQFIFPIFMDKMKGHPAHGLVKSCLDHLKTQSPRFRKASVELDRYIGEYITTIEILNSLVAYGSVSGLVDYWNFKDRKYG